MRARPAGPDQSSSQFRPSRADEGDPSTAIYFSDGLLLREAVRSAKGAVINPKE